MDANTIAAVTAALAALAAALVSLAALPFTRRAANAAAAQTELQAETARQAAQPYVWADLQPDPHQGWTLNFVVGNAGPTVATNVRVTIDPQLELGKSASFDHDLHALLQNGIASLAPGRRIQWPVGTGPEILNRSPLPALHVTVTGDGPHGPLSPNSYIINLMDIRESTDAPEGSLHHVRKAIDSLAERLPKK